MYAELLGKLEAATGPDRELDAMVAVSLQVMPSNAFAPCASPDPGTFGTGAFTFWRTPDYTASIDAALALVERALPGWSLQLHCHPGAAYATLYRLGEIHHIDGTVQRNVASPYFEGTRIDDALAPLAILESLLRALSSIKEVGK